MICEPVSSHCLLLSGGVDSTTLAVWIRGQYPQDIIKAYTFLYGQKHAVELQAAQAVAKAFALEHFLVELPPITGSALTDIDKPLPMNRDLNSVSLSNGVAPSYVPARNLLFLANMASLQDACGPATLWLGVHHDDHSGYPDCRAEFISAADEAVRLGTKYSLRVKAPFANWNKADIIKWGMAHKVPYELTHSCYAGKIPACGVCDTCQARRQAFAEAGFEDPISYEFKG